MSGINAEIIDYLKLEKQVRLDGLEMMDKSAEIPQRLLKEVSIFDRWIEHLANGATTGAEQCNLPIVVCSNCPKVIGLTVGKSYTQLAKYKDIIALVNDYGDLKRYNISYFE